MAWGIGQVGHPTVEMTADWSGNSVSQQGVHNAEEVGITMRRYDIV